MKKIETKQIEIEVNDQIKLALRVLFEKLGRVVNNISSVTIKDGKVFVEERVSNV